MKYKQFCQFLLYLSNDSHSNIVTVCIPCRCTKFAPTVPVKLLRNTNSLYCLDKTHLKIIFFLDFRKGVKKMAAFSDVEHPWSWLHREEIKCSSCPAQVNPFNVWYRHPVLKTIQCSECYKFYNQGRSKVIRFFRSSEP